MMTKEKNDLINQLDEIRAKTLPVFCQLEGSLMIYPEGGWRLMDVINHLAVWEEEVVATLQDYREGKERPAIDASQRTVEDEFNHRHFEARRQWSEQEVYASWEKARNRLKEALNQLSPEQFTAELLFPWGERGTMGRMIRGLIWHEQEHYKEVMKVVEGQ